MMLRRRGAPLPFQEHAWHVKIPKRTHQVLENKGFPILASANEPTAA
jgi:hypothetical protein